MAAKGEDATAIILAAGTSGRMGIPKALIKIPSKETFIEFEIRMYLESGIRQVIAVVNSTVYKVLEYKKPWYFKETKWIINNETEKGRMWSFFLGLQAAEGVDYCFIQNVDQPFVTVSLISDLLKMAHLDTRVVPVFNGKGGHPILIGKEITQNVLSKNPATDDLRDALQPYTRIDIGTNDPLICENINTPEDYKRVFGVRVK